MRRFYSQQVRKGGKLQKQNKSQQLQEKEQGNVASNQKDGPATSQSRHNEEYVIPKKVVRRRRLQAKEKTRNEYENDDQYIQDDVQAIEALTDPLNAVQEEDDIQEELGSKRKRNNTGQFIEHQYNSLDEFVNSNIFSRVPWKSFRKFAWLFCEHYKDDLGYEQKKLGTKLLQVLGISSEIIEQEDQIYFSLKQLAQTFGDGVNKNSGLVKDATFASCWGIFEQYILYCRLLNQEDKSVVNPIDVEKFLSALRLHPKAFRTLLQLAYDEEDLGMIAMILESFVSKGALEDLISSGSQIGLPEKVILVLKDCDEVNQQLTASQAESVLKALNRLRKWQEDLVKSLPQQGPLQKITTIQSLKSQILQKMQRANEEGRVDPGARFVEPLKKSTMIQLGLQAIASLEGSSPQIKLTRGAFQVFASFQAVARAGDLRAYHRCSTKLYEMPQNEHFQVLTFLKPVFLSKMGDKGVVPQCIARNKQLLICPIFFLAILEIYGIFEEGKQEINFQTNDSYWLKKRWLEKLDETGLTIPLTDSDYRMDMQKVKQCTQLDNFNNGNMRHAAAWHLMALGIDSLKISIAGGWYQSIFANRYSKFQDGDIVASLAGFSNPQSYFIERDFGDPWLISDFKPLCTFLFKSHDEMLSQITNFPNAKDIQARQNYFEIQKFLVKVFLQDLCALTFENNYIDLQTTWFYQIFRTDHVVFNCFQNFINYGRQQIVQRQQMAQMGSSLQFQQYNNQNNIYFNNTDVQCQIGQLQEGQRLDQVSENLDNTSQFQQQYQQQQNMGNSLQQNQIGRQQEGSSLNQVFENRENTQQFKHQQKQQNAGNILQQQSSKTKHMIIQKTIKTLEQARNKQNIVKSAEEICNESLYVKQIAEVVGTEAQNIVRILGLNSAWIGDDALCESFLNPSRSKIIENNVKWLKCGLLHVENRVVPGSDLTVDDKKSSCFNPSSVWIDFEFANSRVSQPSKGTGNKSNQVLTCPQALEWWYYGIPLKNQERTPPLWWMEFKYCNYRGLNIQQLQLYKWRNQEAINLQLFKLKPVIYALLNQGNHNFEEATQNLFTQYNKQTFTQLIGPVGKDYKASKIEYEDFGWEAIFKGRKQLWNQ